MIIFEEFEYKESVLLSNSFEFLIFFLGFLGYRSLIFLYFYIVIVKFFLDILLKLVFII